MCKICDTAKDLTINPRILLTLADGSGCVAGEKLVWYDQAWGQLLFPEREGGSQAVRAGRLGGGALSRESLVAMDLTGLRAIEESITYARVTLTFGWSSTVGRLCVLAAEW